MAQAYPEKLLPDFEANLAVMQEIFGADKTVLMHRFAPTVQGKTALRCCLFCVDGMVNSLLINENIIKPVVLHHPDNKIQGDILTYLEQRVIQANETRQSDLFDDIIYALLYGDTIVFCQGSEKALIIGSKGFVRRGVQEPENETVLKGPREGFGEALLHNLGMVRRKVRSSQLKLEYFRVGSDTRTTCALCYIGDLVDQSVLQALKKRLETLKIDGVFDSNYIVELMRDNKLSPFRTAGSTERPDVVAAKLLEGRVAILVDGSPVAVTVPHIFLEQFQSSEDYYVSYHFAALNRGLRILGFLLAISVLPIYIALVTYHQELLPTSLLLSIARARQGVLLPTFAEALVLLCAFELLREAGTRVPAGIGQTLSIVGGLVVGQAAVEARIVSVPMLIVVAFSGITGLIVPKLQASVTLLRLIFLAAAAAVGIYGYILGLLCLAMHLAKQTSFGIPTLSNLPLGQMGSAEDSVVRPRFSVMQKYRRFAAGGRREEQE